MEFVKRLTALRKQRGLTQQALADDIELHVNQIKRYEAGTSQPTLDVIKHMAIALGVTTDALIFDNEERSPDDDLRLQFEAIRGFTDEEKQVTKTVLEGLILKYDAKRFSAG